MIRKISSIIAVLLSFRGTAQNNYIVPAHIGFVYPLSTNGHYAPQRTNAFSLHALSGISRNEKALCISGIAGIVSDTTTGLMVSGIVSSTGKSLTGLQVSGLVSRTGGPVKGMQVSGLVNLADSVLGMQVAGFTNISKGHVHGLQLSGFTGIAGQANAQLSGFYSQARNIDGAQISGFCNLSGNVKGAQMAGFINKAGKVQGVQIAGFINIADSSEYPIGLVNIIKKGEKSLGAMADNTGSTFATFRSGSKTMYGLLGLGINTSQPDLLYCVQAGLGSQLKFARNFRMKAEIFSAHYTNFNYTWNMQSGIRFLPTIKLGALELFAGPGFMLSVFETTASPRFHNSNAVWERTYRCQRYEMYLGGIAGLQILF
jgi:hypothetical protein